MMELGKSLRVRMNPVMYSDLDSDSCTSLGQLLRFLTVSLARAAPELSRGTGIRYHRGPKSRRAVVSLARLLRDEEEEKVAVAAVARVRERMQ